MRRVVVCCGLLVLLLVLPVAAAAEGAESETDEAETVEAAPEEAQKIVVSATRIETPVREVASSTTVIDRAEIERSQKKFVTDVLRQVPGLSVARNGGPGQQAGVRLRGAKSEHTLVLIDGIEANDPFTPGRSFNFGNLTTENIERIEVIRGPQSTVHGSDAIGGVINIVTRKGEGKPRGFLSFEAGSFDTYRESAGISAGSDLINYSLSLSRYDTNGISAADADFAGNEEEDAYTNSTFSGRFGWTPTDAFALDYTVRYSDAEGELDNFGGSFGDDPNHFFDTEQFFNRLQGTLDLADGRWTQTFGVSYTTYDRHFDNDIDPAHPASVTKSDFSSTLLKFDWQNDFRLNESHTVTFGLETEEERGRSETFSRSSFGPFISETPTQEARTNSAYLQDQINVNDTFFAAVGVRWDDHEDFGSEVTYRVAPAYLIHSTGTKLKASYGTGFKAPSLFQLFSSFGDPDLDPETSDGWDVGLEQYLFGDRVLVGATYFQNDFEDLIDFGPASQFVNVDEAESNGVEVFADWRAADNVDLRASYTHQDTEDETTGDELIRRPRNKATFDVNYRPREDTNLNLSLVWVGERDDLAFIGTTSRRVELDSYTLVNLAGSHDLSDRVQLFGRVENLLNEDYQEVFGFGTQGIGFFGGVKLTF